MPLKMRWLGTACFELALPNGKTLVTDPYLDDSVSAPIRSEQIESCDFIFITHGHYDHVLDVGKLADRFQPRIFCGSATADSLTEHQGVDSALITRVRVGDEICEDGLKVDVLRGVHVDFGAEYRRLTGRELPAGTAGLMEVVKGSLADLFETDWLPEQFEEWMACYPQGEQLNFVFEPAGGKRIYMAGSYPDPGVIEAAPSTRADITLLQVLPGNTLNGLEERVADLAAASGCEVVVPQHHDPLLRGAKPTDLSELKRILAEKTSAEFRELIPGEWYSFA